MKKVENTNLIIKYSKVLNNICDQYEQLWDNESERSSVLFQLCSGMWYGDVMNEWDEYMDLISFIDDTFGFGIEKKRTQFMELWDNDPSESIEEQFAEDLAECWLVNQIEEYMITNFK